jgi:hypothetical protein
MKKIIFYCFISLILICFNNVSAQWISLPGPEGGPIDNLVKVGNQLWAGSPGGIYISTDEGLMWHRSTLINEFCEDIVVSNDSVVVCYAVYDTTDPGAMLMNNFSIASFDGGTTWSTPSLIYPLSNWYIGPVYQARSTCIMGGKISYDFGQSWGDFNLPYGNYINHIYADGRTFLLQTINTADYNAGPQNFISTDGAITWQPMSSANYIYDFYVRDSLMLFSITDTTNSLNQFYIVRSADFGSTWDTVCTGQPGQIFLDFRNVDGDILTLAGNTDIYKSSDDGLTWVLTQWPGALFYSDVIHLSNGDKLGISDGGLKRFIASSGTLIPANNGFSGQDINYLTSNNNVLFASVEFASFRSTDAGQTWQNMFIPAQSVNSMVFKGDTVFCIAGDHIGKSFDNGITWDTLSPPSNIYNGDFVYSVEMHNNRLFFSGEGIFFSDDFGQSWNNLPDLPFVPSNPCYTNLDTVGRLKVFENELFCISPDGFVFKFNTVLQSWQYLTCFWSTGAYTNNGLYSVDSALFICGMAFKYSYDQGQTWITPTANGLNRPPSSIVSVNGLWVCNDFLDGVFMSNDQGENWLSMHVGILPFHPHRGLTVMGGTLFAGSYYKSVWRRQGTFETISGIAYLDANNNGVKDISETVLPEILINTIPSSWSVSTDTNGAYSFVTDMSGDTLGLTKPNPFAVSNPPYYLVNGAATGQDFGIYIPSGIKDLSVDISNVSVFRSGFQTQLLLTAKNFGSVKQPAQVQLMIDSSLSFISADPLPDIVTGNQYTWVIDSISFSESRVINIVVTTNIGSALGDTIKCKANVLPVIHDTVPQNNSCELKDIIMGSYDPNDKRCLQGEYIIPQQIIDGEELIYIIRFQNTGNYPASFIHIIDTLCQYFDLSTFRVISSSHPMSWSMLQNNVMDFYFQNIQLPASTMDELNSHGFVKFSIKCKSGVGLGNALTNTAYIYFDFNPAIVTNTTATFVVNPFLLSIPEDFTENGVATRIRVYPNPTSDEINIDVSSLEVSEAVLMICNVSGDIIMEDKILTSLHKIQMKGFPAGMYFGIIVNPLNRQKVSFKFILRK